MEITRDSSVEETAAAAEPKKIGGRFTKQTPDKQNQFGMDTTSSSSDAK